MAGIETDGDDRAAGAAWLAAAPAARAALTVG
jgi:hypothetical protein